jgi:hypothetical protein
VSAVTPGGRVVERSGARQFRLFPALLWVGPADLQVKWVSVRFVLLVDSGWQQREVDAFGPVRDLLA